jgi:hypothetical protein
VEDSSVVTREEKENGRGEKKRKEEKKREKKRKKEKRREKKRKKKKRKTYSDQISHPVPTNMAGSSPLKAMA